MRRGSRTCIVYSVTVVFVFLGAGIAALAQAPSRPAAQEYVFPTGAGVLFFHVRPERADDFEAVVKRLAEALDRSIDPVRRQQAANWRIYRSAETPREAVIYLFFFDPAVSGADYDPIKILSEDAPAELSGLFERLRADIVRVERMGLSKLR
jgi:hypothetical protein